MRDKLQKKNYSYWSKQEITLLKKLYSITLLRDVVKFFPKRNKGTIAAKALSLKLKSAKLWQPEENKILRNNFSIKSLKEISGLLPKRSRLAILARGERLGLKRNLHAPRKKVNESYFKKWTQGMAYILGFILTDGCIIEGTYKGYSDALKFGVQIGDIDILEKIKQELESEHTISLIKNAAYFGITSQKIVDDLKNLKISYRKSLREKIPKVPNRFIKDYIRGIVDGDGSISFDKRNYPSLSICGGKRTISFVRNYFLSKLSTYSKIRKCEKSKNGKYHLFSIGYHCNSAKILINHLYNKAPLYLDRKFNLAKRCTDVIMKYRKDYTKKENQTIRRFYPSLLKDRIRTMLPNRSWTSIQQKARVLKVYKYNV